MAVALQAFQKLMKSVGCLLAELHACCSLHCLGAWFKRKAC